MISLLQPIIPNTSTQIMANLYNPQKHIYRILLFAVIFCTVGYTSFAQTPTITSLSAASGPIGSSVVINGSGFNATSSNDFVFFGATRAAVTSATTSSLTVTVPFGATYQYISVTNVVTNLTAYSRQPFVVTFPNGNIAFSPRQDVFDSIPSQLAIADIDGDGKPDLVLVNSLTNSVSIFLNTSTAGFSTFAPPVDIPTGPGPYAVAIGDLDGDGKPDVVVTNYGGGAGNTATILRNKSTAHIVSFSPQANITTGTGPQGVVIGDLDGDGKPDVAVANSNSNNVMVFHNTSPGGTITFAAPVNLTAANNPGSLCIGDIDGDGKPDLAVTNLNSNNISVFRNTFPSPGTVSFSVGVFFTAGGQPSSVSIGDLDNDGKPDLAVANLAGNSVTLFRNTASLGVINPSSLFNNGTISTGTQPNSVSIGDIDGDGKPDLVVANSGSNTISVFKNTSTMTFAPQVTFSTEVQPISLSIGDIDMDGRPDVVTANVTSFNASVLLQLPPPQGSLTANTLCGPGTGQLTFTATAGNGPFKVLYYDSTANQIDSALGVVSGTPFNVFNNPVTVRTSYKLLSVTDAGNAKRNSSFTLDSAHIVVNPAVIANAGPGGAICQGTSYHLGGSPTASGGSGGFSYQWSNGAGFTANPFVTPAVTTNYTVTVTDSKGCQATATATVTVLPLPTTTPTNNGPLCAGSNLSLSANSVGAVTYAWAGPNSFTSTVQNPTIPGATVAAAGTYSITVTSPSGCASTAFTNVIINSAPVVSVNSITNVTCNGNANGSITVTVSGGTPAYTYHWNTGATTQNIGGLGGGTYVLTVTDASGCSASVSAIVSEPAPLNISLSSGTITCYGGTTFLTVGGTGGTPPYSNVGTSSPYSASTYFVTIHDSHGCSAFGQITISQPAATTIVATGLTTFCQGGSVTLDAGSHTSYVWSTGATTESIVVSTSATYSVTTTDNGGSCTGSASQVVTVNPPPTASASSNSPINSGSTLNLTANGGGPIHGQDRSLSLQAHKTHLSVMRKQSIVVLIRLR